MKNLATGSTLADLPTHRVTLDAQTILSQVVDDFERSPHLPGVIVQENNRLLGVVSRDELFRRLSGPFCRELFLRKPIRSFMEIFWSDFLRIEAGCTIHRAAELALSRSHEMAYEPILVDYGNEHLRLLDAYSLLIAQSQLLALSKVIADERDAAEAANRSKSEFLANISHEIRTPLHGILSYAKFGMSDYADADRGELREFFEKVGQSAEILLGLVNDLLDLSKLEAGRMTFEFQDTDLSNLIEAVVDEFRSLCADKDLHIHFHRPDEDIVVPADPDRLKQVVRNLLSNAVKFSPPSGNIYVRARSVAKLALFSVRDEGLGIPPEELELVFEKFVQSSKTKSGSGGTGLGLAISREIAAGHQGRIWVENNSDSGCIFYCELPLAKTEEDATDPLTMIDEDFLKQLA